MAVAAFLAASVWHFRYLASPSWSVSVVTADGQALAGVNVRLVYQNYSAEGASHELTVITDREGHAGFASRY